MVPATAIAVGETALLPVSRASLASVFQKSPATVGRILAKIDKYLREAGSDKSKIVSANIWLSDIRTFNQMNKVWDAWVSPGNTPARATVQSDLATPQLQVEIMCVASL